MLPQRYTTLPELRTVGADWVLPIDGPPVADGVVVFSEARVVSVRRDLTPDVRHDGVLLPGLVNAHAHSEYGPAFADLAAAGHDFAAWIAELTRRRHLLAEDEWYEQSLASGRRMLATGTTCVADVVTHGPGLAALSALGLAGTSYLEVVGADLAVWTDRELPRVERLLAAPGRDRGLSPHTLYTLDGEVIRSVVSEAAARGLRLHPHLAETQAEASFVRDGTGPLAVAMARTGLALGLLAGGCGRSPAAQLDHLGGLGPGTHVAHGVHCDAADRALLRRRGTAVALCPRSNRALGAGSAPVAHYLREGSPVALGTDSLASVGSLDLLEELRALRELAPQTSPQRLVRIVTGDGAAALGRSDVGSLRPGGRADFAVVPATDDDPYLSVVQGRTSATYLAGEPV